MDDLAESVGLAKPTLYHYVTSKQDVLYLIHEELFTDLSATYESREASALSPLDGLLEVMVDMIAVLDARGEYLRVFFDYYNELTASDRLIIEERRREYEARVVQLFEKGVAEGYLRQDVPIRMMVMAFFGVCNWAHRWYRTDGPLSAREVAGELWEVVMGGVVTRETKPPATTRASTTKAAATPKAPVGTAKRATAGKSAPSAGRRTRSS